MKNPTLDEFKAWAKEHHDLAVAVCKAQAFAELERERVDAYIKPIFDQFEFAYKSHLAERFEFTGRITDRKDLYLCEDEENLNAYYAACDAANREHGFTGPQGHCPALLAEHLHIQAQNAMIQEWSKWMEVDFAILDSEKRQRLIDLLLGGCLKEK